MLQNGAYILYGVVGGCIQLVDAEAIGAVSQAGSAALAGLSFPEEREAVHRFS